MNMSDRAPAFCDGISRRSLIKAGIGGMFGLTLADMLRLRAKAAETGASRRETSVIFVELAGGPTQHETYDPKPHAPQEYRGPLDPVQTALPGVFFSQYMAEQARIAGKLAVIRSIRHDSGSHGTSSHLAQTGYYLRDNQNRENEMPCLGSIAARVRGNGASGLPTFVSIPNSMRYGRSAWLGKGYNPFETMSDSAGKSFEVPNLTLIGGLTSDRLSDRRSLLYAFDGTRRTIDNQGAAEVIDQFTHRAFDLVTGDAARKAFDIGAEDQKVRDAYGMNSTGQNLLLARRLVEHGVGVVTVRVTGWDDHTQIAAAMEKKGPSYDRGLAALVNDLHDRGLDRQTLVVCMGEFGRTPRVNANAGRDHWGQLMSVVLACGGLRTGQIVGASDKNGTVPIERPYRPENVLAVVYRHLGIDPHTTFIDNSGRPRFVLERRELITEVVG
jgi:hypothetical protein